MNDQVGNLIFERLGRMDDRLSNIADNLHHQKLRTTVMEEHLGNIVLSIAGVNGRMDRFDERLSRVERPLELSEAR